MLKKVGFVAVGVTAGMATLAPFASAATEDHHSDRSSATCSQGNGNLVPQVGQCSSLDQSGGQGGVLHGTPVANPSGMLDAVHLG